VSSTTGEPCVSVLVVEDDPDIRQVVVTALEDEGFHTASASNGAEALKVLERLPRPVLLFVDLMMPVMDGPSLIAALRANDKLATLPVVVMSAASDGVPGYPMLRKPFKLEDLVGIVDSYCVRRI
jgi:CheY-like chemotaxis protein